MKKSKAFTLVEMLVTVMIIVVIASASVISLSSGTGSTAVANGSDELQGLIDQLKSFTAGPDQERAAHYVLIIRQTTAAGSADYCNKDTSGEVSLTGNQYLICATQDKDISAYDSSQLNQNFNKVVAGNFSSNLAISSLVFDTPSFNDAIVINGRTFDGQIAYDLKYCDTNSSYCTTTPTITVTQGSFNKTLTLNPILGILN